MRSALAGSLFPLLCLGCGGEEFIANQAPRAFAGFDQTLASGSELRLDGRLSSDPDGNALSFKWRVLRPSDDALRLIEAESPQPLLVADPGFAGQALIELLVSDGVSLSQPDWLSLHFSPSVARLPVAKAGPNFLHPDPNEALVLSSSDPGFQGDQRWQHVLAPDGQPRTLPAGPLVEIEQPVPGGHLFALLVEDARGLSLPDFLSVGVGRDYASHDLPQIEGPDHVQAGASFSLRASHSEEGRWSLVSAPEEGLQLPDPLALGQGASSIRLTFAARGRYVIAVTAASGLSDWHAMEVL